MHRYTTYETLTSENERQSQTNAVINVTTYNSYIFNVWQTQQ